MSPLKSVLGKVETPSSNTTSSRSRSSNRTNSTAHLLFFSLLLLGVVNESSAQFDPKPEQFLEWVENITDPTIPLPSCDEVGAFEALTCQALCEAIDGGDVNLDETRDVNGGFTCTCEKQVACNDRPTCKQLTMKPGMVDETCASICGQGRIMATIDKMEFAGSSTAANKDMSHFIMQCRCDGEILCDDYVLFSDIGQPITCKSLEITDQDTCDTYCNVEGGGLFDLMGNFTYVDGTTMGACSCLATDTKNVTIINVAPACSDVPIPEGPEACTLQEGAGCNDEKPNGEGGNGGGGGGGGGSSATCNYSLTRLVALLVATGVTTFASLGQLVL